MKSSCIFLFPSNTKQSKSQLSNVSVSLPVYLALPFADEPRSRPVKNKLFIHQQRLPVLFVFASVHKSVCRFKSLNKTTQKNHLALAWSEHSRRFTNVSFTIFRFPTASNCFLLYKFWMVVGRRHYNRETTVKLMRARGKGLVGNPLVWFSFCRFPWLGWILPPWNTLVR